MPLYPPGYIPCHLIPAQNQLPQINIQAWAIRRTLWSPRLILLFATTLIILRIHLLLQPIEVANVVAVLDDAELLELAQGVFVGLGLGDATGTVEDLAVVEVEEGI